ncbi:MAG TPA: ATP-binding protein, partial [Methylomirabilota bacterium]|nr:ATP-binding protein [Methylomirabilota bacterium]
ILDLQKKHVELEERRRYTETILEAVATGVISLDPSGRLTTMNRAAARMLGLSTEAGQPAQQVFAGPEFAELATLIQRMDRLREGTLDREIRLRRDGHQATLLGSATALRGPHGEYAGMVLVFDDLTELLKAQRLAAWREVAQRIAHEIKNPLTPIQLSAERLRRRLADRLPDERRLLEECTQTIIQEVEGLRQLVDEFSRFARMPKITPRPTELNRLLEGVAGLYAESQAAVSVTTQFSPDLPIAEVDPDQIKRAVLNLVENAVEAVRGNGTVLIETSWDPDSHRVRIIVSDTGVGISSEDKEKLFLPYFSTKATGMGLGLPIVNQIVTDHGGAIWVEDNHPRGSRFVIELPIERAHAAVQA